MIARAQNGFSLIEALVAMVVLTMGILGIAALQITSMRNTQGSYARSQATNLSNGLAERIYANTPGAINYGGFDSNANNACITPANTCATESAASAVACSTSNMATYDLNKVGCGASGAQGLLTSGRLQVDCLNAAGAVTACAAGLRIRITVSWTERGTIVEGSSAAAMDAANLVTQSVNLVIQP
jgi:type IV pilus assembly protein PilV